MTRLSGVPAGAARKASPDVYTALLLVGILFLLTGCVFVCWDLMQSYGYSFGQIFSSWTPPPQ